MLMIDAILGIGWILGVVGFFRTRKLTLELATMRARLDALAPVPTAPASPLPDEPSPTRRIDWEELITARWGVWLGAGALLLAGVFLVRYAVDRGLLGPAVRCIGMVVLSAALAGAGEWLHRRPAETDQRVDYAPSALTAGAVAILFGAAYMAGPLYQLVPSTIGFGLMGAAGIAGLALSLRMGQLVAAVGIVGAFVTPMLVQVSTPSVPGLFFYLLVVTAACAGVVRLTAWTWLGWAASIAGAVWVAAAALLFQHHAIWAPGLFVPAAVLVSLLLLPVAALEKPLGRRLAWLPLAMLGAAGLLLAVAAPEFFSRAGVLLLAPITIAKAAAEPRLDRLPWLAAALFLLLLFVWGMPADPPPLLWTAALVSAGYAMAGLWFERRSVNPLHWSVLVAAVPVLALAILYLRIAGFRSDALWAGAALAFAAGLTLATTTAPRQCAGVHAAGAVAALALGCAILLTAQWLTLAFALFLPPLAWIEDRADLPALRRVALAIALLTLMRLLFNPYVLFYSPGAPALLNDTLPVFLAACAAFALTAHLLRRRADDMTVALLELGSVAFATVLVMLQIRQWATGGHPALTRTDFLECSLQVSVLAVMAYATLRLAVRTGRPMLDWAWRIQGGLALVSGGLLIVANPAVTPATLIGPSLLFNAMLAAYVAPALIAAMSLRQPTAPRPLLTGYALLAAFAWLTLTVRHGFHPQMMLLGREAIEPAELWAYSGAWMAYGLALMAIGIFAAQKSLRLAALAVVALAGAKVFLLDMAGLVGLWRVLSFLGLGLTLIGIGAVYRRFVAPMGSNRMQPPAGYDKAGK
jgi:uncharacterized membrane protein